jgi:hypothetical protein
MFEVSHVQVKKSIGLQEPSVMDKLRNRFGTGAQETVESAAHLVCPARSCSCELSDCFLCCDQTKEAVDKAQEMLSGGTYDDTVHKVSLVPSFEGH